MNRWIDGSMDSWMDGFLIDADNMQSGWMIDGWMGAGGWIDKWVNW